MPANTRANRCLDPNGTHKLQLTFDVAELDGVPAGSSSPNYETGQVGTLFRVQYQVAFQAGHYRLYQSIALRMSPPRASIATCQRYWCRLNCGV